MASPALTRITSVYGYSEQYGTKFHGGIDFANADRRVFAYASGTVVWVGWVSGWAGLGLVVIIDHGYGIQSWSCHLAGSLVQVGDRVAAGQHVATMGNSATTDVHLHWEIRINGVRVDPTPYLTASAATDITPFSPEEDDMPAYIWTDQDGAGYALIDSNYVDGCIITGDIATANQFSYLSSAWAGGGAPRKLDRATFNAVCASTVALWRAHAYRAGNVAVDIDEAAIAAAVVKALGPTLASDADLEKLRKDIIEAIPTKFVVG